MFRFERKSVSFALIVSDANKTADKTTTAEEAAVTDDTDSNKTVDKTTTAEEAAATDADANKTADKTTTVEETSYCY